MLNRLPLIKEIYFKESNESHKKVIEAGIEAQKPLLEQIMGGKAAVNGNSEGVPLYSQLVFNAIWKGREFPVKPQGDFLRFAREVAQGFDSYKLAEKLGHGLPAASDNGKALNYDFFIYSLNGTRGNSLRHVLVPAEGEIRTMEIWSLAAKFAEGEHGLKELLEAKGVNAGSVKLVREGGTNMLKFEMANNGGIAKISARYPKALEERSARIGGLIGEVAKRLSFGFDGALLENGKNEK